MWVFTRKSRLLSVVLLALIVGLAASATSFAQGRGRGRNRDDWGDRRDKSDKKCEKFVNCHDARDGRWDGRGPNRSGYGRFDDRYDDRYDRDRRMRDYRYDDSYDRYRRIRNRDRYYNDDDYRRIRERRIRNYRYYNRGSYPYYNNYYSPNQLQQGGLLNGLLDLIR